MPALAERDERTPSSMRAISRTSYPSEIALTAPPSTRATTTAGVRFDAGANENAVHGRVQRLATLAVGLGNHRRLGGGDELSVMGGHGNRVVGKAGLQQKVDHALAAFLGV